jgi:hypothetical protein
MSMRSSRFLVVALAILSVVHAAAAPAGGSLSVAGPLGEAFVPGIGACIAADPGSVLSGQRSIKAEYWGDDEYATFLDTNPSVLRLAPRGRYELRFSYKLLAGGGTRVEVTFRSEQGGAAGSWLPGILLEGPAGTSGVATLVGELGPWDDYFVRWCFRGTGAILVDDIEIADLVTGGIVAREGAEGQPLHPGALEFAVEGCAAFSIFPGEGGYIRSAALHDLDGDGSPEAILTFSTYPSQLPVPLIVLGTRRGVSVETERFFPRGALRLRHSSVTLLRDVTGDGRADLVVGDAGLDHPPWTGSTVGIGLAQPDGTYRDASSLVPETLRDSRTAAIAVGDPYAEGSPGILMPDQSGGDRVALLEWRGSAFTARSDWTDRALWSGYPLRLAATSTVEISDMDGDGREDLVLGGQHMAPNTRVFWNDTRRRFTDPSTLLTLPDGPYGHIKPEWKGDPSRSIIRGADANVIVVDLDRDGLKDIVSFQEEAISVQPGVVTDTRLHGFTELREKGGTYYRSFAVQVFMNKGGRRLEERRSGSGVLDLGPARYYYYWAPFDMNGDGFTDIVAGYVTRPYGGDPGADYGTIFLLNDGTGAFRVVEGQEILPWYELGGKRLELGIFLPIRAGAGGTAGLAIEAKPHIYGASVAIYATKLVSASTLGTGPGFVDSAALGAPGFNETYYLGRYTDAAQAVREGAFPSGLAHYLDVGAGKGYQAFAANATIRGVGSSRTLVLAGRKSDFRATRDGAIWRLQDRSGRYGTLVLEGIERLRFSDATATLGESN